MIISLLLWLVSSAALLFMTLAHPSLPNEPVFSPYFLVNGAAGLGLLALMLANFWSLVKLPASARTQRINLQSLAGLTLAMVLAVAMMAA